MPALRRLSEEGLVDIVALCSRTEESLLSAQILIGSKVALYTDLDAMLANEDIDVVDLVLPTPIIGSAIKKSFAAGKHVISEKPCSPTVDTCKELIAALDASDHDVTWSVAENWPFKSSVRAIKNILDTQILGGVKNVNFTYKSPGWGAAGHGWRTGQNFKGGYLLDSGVHFVSMLRYLFGEIKEVDASVGWHEASRVADKVTAKVLYENNTEGQFLLDFTQAQGKDDPYHLVAEFDNGFLTANFIGNQILLKAGNNTQVVNVSDDPWVQGGVYAMLRHCCESLTNGTPTSCTPVEGLRDVAAIEAMLESHRISRPVMPTLLHKQLNGCASRLSTYGNLYISKPQHLVAARSISDVRVALKEAASHGLKVRAVGAGNNWTTYSSTKDVAIDV
ncbi:MAG: hypothetical protein RI959_1176, partial [Pseudomonadota bacterium]